MVDVRFAALCLAEPLDRCVPTVRLLPELRANDSLKHSSTATMHILRCSYLPLYTQHVLRPFSTDAFPSTVTSITPRVQPNTAHSQPPAAMSDVIMHDVTPIISTQRETSILDLFIIIRAREDMKSDETDLYLDNDDERYRDMFNYMQVGAECRTIIDIVQHRTCTRLLYVLRPAAYLTPRSI